MRKIWLILTACMLWSAQSLAVEKMEIQTCVMVDKIKKDCKDRGLHLITCLNEREMKEFVRMKNNCEYYTEYVPNIVTPPPPQKVKPKQQKPSKPIQEQQKSITSSGKISRFYRSAGEYWRATMRVDRPKKIKCVVYDKGNNPLTVHDYRVTPPFDEIVIKVTAPPSVVDTIQCFGL